MYTFTYPLGHELVEMYLTMLETQSWLLESQNMDYSDPYPNIL